LVVRSKPYARLVTLVQLAATPRTVVLSRSIRSAEAALVGLVPAYITLAPV